MSEAASLANRWGEAAPDPASVDYKRFGETVLDLAVPCRDSADGEESPFYPSSEELAETSSRAKGVMRKKREERAAEICSHCAYREPCLASALHQDEHNGVWGGMSFEKTKVVNRMNGSEKLSRAQLRTEMGITIKQKPRTVPGRTRKK